METEEQATGVTSTVRRLAGTFLRTLQNRAELLGLELEEEGRWFVSALVWACAAIFLTVLATTFVTVTVILIVPESARAWVLGGFSVVFVILAISAGFGLRKHWNTRRPPLVDTVNELKKDLEWIRSRE